jgi:hypothetical protein
VGPRSSEVLQRGAETLTRDEAQVGLEAAPQANARLRLAMREYPLDETILGEGVHQ